MVTTRKLNSGVQERLETGDTAGNHLADDEVWQPQADEDAEHAGGRRLEAEQDRADRGTERRGERGQCIGAEADLPPGAAQAFAQRIRSRHDAPDHGIEAAVRVAAQIERGAHAGFTAKAGCGTVDTLPHSPTRAIRECEDEAEGDDAGGDADDEEKWTVEQYLHDQPTASRRARSRPKYSARGVKCGRRPAEMKLPASLPSAASPSNL